jgi:hypothetical protein
LGQSSTKRYPDLGSKHKKAIIERLKATGKEKLAISLLPGNGKEVCAAPNFKVALYGIVKVVTFRHFRQYSCHYTPYFHGLISDGRGFFVGFFRNQRICGLAVSDQNINIVSVQRSQNGFEFSRPTRNPYRSFYFTKLFQLH